jgi:hypothetical protein
VEQSDTVGDNWNLIDLKLIDLLNIHATAHCLPELHHAISHVMDLGGKSRAPTMQLPSQDSNGRLTLRRLPWAQGIPG